MVASKLVLITGAGSGFGRGAAVELAARGHRVVATTADDEQAAELRTEHADLTVRKLDITDPADVASAAEWDVDVLINNAGLGCIAPLARVPLDEVRRVFDVNVLGTLAISQVVIARMLERGSGRVLIVSSVAGLLPAGAMSAPYSMTKHALEIMGGALRIELEPHGIEVGLINPGPYGTGFNDRMADRAVERYASQGAAASDAAKVHALHDRITIDQRDPQEVVTAMVDLVEAEQIPLQTIVPPDLMERFSH
jgi:NAD(P)-dependent dehydrogenase (short-subunit alcohol dehydrogenase family)